MNCPADGPMSSYVQYQLSIEFLFKNRKVCVSTERFLKMVDIEGIHGINKG